MRFMINQKATLTHINVRKEGKDEERVTALDAKFSATVPAQALQPIVGNESVREVVSAFWDPDGEPRFLALSEIRADGITAREMEVNLVGMRILEGCSCTKFRFTPAPGQTAELVWTLHVQDPPGSLLPLLATYLGEETTVRIEPLQGDLAFANRDQEAERHGEAA